MKKKVKTEYAFIIIFAVILLFLGIWYVFYKSDTNQSYMEAKTVVFSCSTGTFTIDYAEGGQTADISLGAEKYTLTRETTASGTKYYDAGSTVSFSEHQGEAKVAVADTVIFEDCAPQS